MAAVDTPGMTGRAQSQSAREQLFDILSNTRRRYTLRYLLQRDEPVPIRDLSAQVAAWENDKSVSQVTSTERHRVYNALQQAHLPKMERANILELQNGLVVPTDSITDVEVYLEVVPGNDIPWSVYYTAIGVIGLLTTLGWVVGVPPLRALPPLAYLAGLAGLLTGSGLVHVLRQREMRVGGPGDERER